MKKEVADKWVAALRSGKYQQTQGYLRDSDGFCCLGVLCDIFAKDLETEWQGHLAGHRYDFLGQGFHLPTEVYEIADLTVDTCSNLQEMNDGDSRARKAHSFNEIADYIEKNWESL